MPATITRKKTAEGKALEHAVEQLKKRPYVAIGIQGAKASDKEDGGEFTVVQVAAIHEFGSSDGKIPQRSFIRSNDTKNAASYRKIIERFSEDIFFGRMTVEKAFGLLGQKVASDIKMGIRAGISPELKPATIKRKGSSTPLIDTGQLINSITYVINEQGDEGGS